MLTRVLKELLQGPADPPRRRKVSISGVTMELARIDDELVATLPGSFAPSFAWGAPVIPVSISVGELDGRNIYAGPWSQMRPERWLEDEGNRELLSAMHLSKGEQLLVASNVIEVRGHADDPILWQERVENLVQLAKALMLSAELEPGLSDLIQLGIDRRLVSRWAIGDDALRAEAIYAASEADLQDLISAVQTVWPRIAPLIEGQRHDPASVLVGRLTDASQEAELELARRPAKVGQQSPIANDPP